LEPSNDFSASYANAKKFIARAGLLSRKEAAAYFGVHPPNQISDPVTKAKRFDPSQPIEQQQNSAPPHSLPLPHREVQTNEEIPTRNRMIYRQLKTNVYMYVQVSMYVFYATKSFYAHIYIHTCISKYAH
jgi:hypothetical protein